MANKKNSGVRQKTHDGVDKVMDRAEIMRKGSMEAMVRIKEKAIDMKENVDDYIRKNPKKAVRPKPSRRSLKRFMLFSVKEIFKEQN